MNDIDLQKKLTDHFTDTTGTIEFKMATILLGRSLHLSLSTFNEGTLDIQNLILPDLLTVKHAIILF